MLKLVLAAGDKSCREISDQLKLPLPLIEPFLAQLKTDQMIGFVGQANMNDYICRLSDTGRERARRYCNSGTYYGATPVPIGDYIQSIKHSPSKGSSLPKNRFKKYFRTC